MRNQNSQLGISDLQADFLVEARLLRNLKPATLKLYESSFRQFRFTLDDFENPRLPTLAALQINRQLQPSTARTHIVRLITFARWLNSRGVIELRHALHLKPPKPKPSQLPTLAELEALYAALDAHVAHTSPGRRRAARNHRLIVRVLVATGMRVGECLSLSSIDLCDDAGSDSLTVTEGKSRAAERAIRITPGLAAELREHCTRQTGRLIFQSPRGTAIRRETISTWLREFSHGAGLQTKITPHVLRHYFIIHAAVSGKSLFDVMTELGHATPRQTIYYFNRARRLYPAARVNRDVGFIERGEN
jgi:integrase/recombinase XerD